MNKSELPSKLFFQNKLFIGFLMLGLMSGSLIGQFSKSRALQKSAGNRQKNVLVALVEDASVESSALLGLWLAAIPDQNIEISWMPIFPVPNNENSIKSEEGQRGIVIENSIYYSWETLSNVRDSGVFWDQVILIDAEAIAAILPNTSENLFGQLSNPEENGFKAFFEQLSIIQLFCQLQPENITLEIMLTLFEDKSHLRSTFSNFELITLWDRFFLDVGNSMECQHPWAQ